MQQTATGTHTRIQLQRPGQNFIPHGSVLSYNPVTGVIIAQMDYQVTGEPALTLTPHVGGPAGFTDQDNLEWSIVR